MFRTHICLRNICKDVTLIPLYLINYSIWANINILTWVQLVSIIDCIGIYGRLGFIVQITQKSCGHLKSETGAVKVDTV